MSVDRESLVPSGGGRRRLEVVSTGQPAPRGAWMREFDKLQWCEWCRNYRSEPHIIEHGRMVAEAAKRVTRQR